MNETQVSERRTHGRSRALLRGLSVEGLSALHFAMSMVEAAGDS